MSTQAGLLSDEWLLGALWAVVAAVAAAAAASAPYCVSGRFSSALTQLGRAMTLAPSSFILRPRALAWLDSCGLIFRTITGLLIFTHLVFFITDAWGMVKGWRWGKGVDE